MLHPLGHNSPIEAFLKRNPDGGMHHVCLEVNDIYKAVKELKEKKIRVLNDEPKVCLEGYILQPQVNFTPTMCVHSKPHGVLATTCMEAKATHCHAQEFAESLSSL